ncbi:MAG: hypothetical protein FWE21_09195 [Defluviitaleaceae bacterium]|nr:hypothetical protein [Defluviitaleaceae bacterium]
MNFEEKMLSMMETLVSRFDNLESRFDILENRFDNLENRFDKLESRFDKLEDRFDKLEAEVKQGFTEVRKDIRGLQEETAEFGGDFAQLEVAITKLEKVVETSAGILANLEIKQEREVKAMFDYMNLALDKVREIWDKALEVEKEQYGVRIKILEERVTRLEKAG